MEKNQIRDDDRVEEAYISLSHISPSTQHESRKVIYDGDTEIDPRSNDAVLSRLIRHD